MKYVNEASPGTADRNRTLGAKKLNSILVPLPQISKQIWFDQICQQIDVVNNLQKEYSVNSRNLFLSQLEKEFKQFSTINN